MLHRFQRFIFRLMNGRRPRASPWGVNFVSSSVPVKAARENNLDARLASDLSRRFNRKR
jgi:hypothetical protein